MAVVLSLMHDKLNRNLPSPIYIYIYIYCLAGSSIIGGLVGVVQSGGVKWRCKIGAKIDGGAKVRC